MPDLPILIIAIIVMLLVSHASSKNSRKRFYAQHAKRANPSGHTWVDNDPSGCAVLVCVIIAVVAAVAALHF